MDHNNSQIFFPNAYIAFLERENALMRYHMYKREEDLKAAVKARDEEYFKSALNILGQEMKRKFHYAQSRNKKPFSVRLKWAGPIGQNLQQLGGTVLQPTPFYRSWSYVTIV